MATKELEESIESLYREYCPDKICKLCNRWRYICKHKSTTYFLFFKNGDMLISDKPTWGIKARAYMIIDSNFKVVKSIFSNDC